jgi:hypothetical protein
MVCRAARFATRTVMVMTATRLSSLPNTLRLPLIPRCKSHRAVILHRCIALIGRLPLYECRQRTNVVRMLPTKRRRTEVFVPQNWQHRCRRQALIDKLEPCFPRSCGRRSHLPVARVFGSSRTRFLRSSGR